MTNGNFLDLTFSVGENWQQLDENERISRVQNFLLSHEMYIDIEVCNAQANGHIVLKINRQISADKRGEFLLDLEEKIKSDIDIGLTIWLEPVGDKSKLRQLRGIEINNN